MQIEQALARGTLGTFGRVGGLSLTAAIASVPAIHFRLQGVSPSLISLPLPPSSFGHGLLPYRGAYVRLSHPNIRPPQDPRLYTAT